MADNHPSASGVPSDANPLADQNDGMLIISHEVIKDPDVDLMSYKSVYESIYSCIILELLDCNSISHLQCKYMQVANDAEMTQGRHDTRQGIVDALDDALSGRPRRTVPGEPTAIRDVEMETDAETET